MTLPIINEMEKKFDEKWNKKTVDTEDIGHRFLIEIKSFIFSTYTSEIIGAVDKELKKLRVITPTIEPPPNKLSQNQVFAGGQMNMLMRMNEVLNKFIEK